MTINGTGGRLETQEYHRDPFDRIRYWDRKGNWLTYEIARATGGHGGGDARLLRMLFVGDLPDPLGLMAGSRAGAMSILTGVAANQSIAAGKAIRVAALLSERS